MFTAGILKKMKVVILYQPNSETDTRVQTYARDFERQLGKKLELIDSNTAEAVEIAKIHDIMQFPAILVTEDDGSAVQMWTDIDSWPTFSELSYYTQ